jgi:LIM domain
MWKRTIPDPLPPLYPPHMLAQLAPSVAQPQPASQPKPRVAASAPVPAQSRSQFSRPNANATAPASSLTGNLGRSYGYYPNGYNATRYAPQQNNPAQASANAHVRAQEESSEEEEEDDEEEESVEDEGQYERDNDDDDDGGPSDSSTESDLSDEDPQAHTTTQGHRERRGGIGIQGSPQYGIRDLPSRMTVGPLPQPPAMVRNGQGQSAPTPARPQSSWDASRDGGGSDSGSRTMQLAAVSGVGSSEGGTRWPQGLPRLPHTPGSKFATNLGRRLDLDLDDTPPPASPSFAMRRSPSPSPVVEQQAMKRRELPQPMHMQERERQSHIYAASSSSIEQEQGREVNARPHSQAYVSVPAKQQHGGPRAPSQMQHHQYHQLQHQTREHERNDVEYQFLGMSMSSAPDPPPRRQPLPEYPSQHHQPQPQHRHQPQPGHEPYYQPQHQHQHQHQEPQMQPQIKIESPAPIGGRDRLADIPQIELEGAAAGVPSINVVDEGASGSDSEVPTITVQGDDDGDATQRRGKSGPQIKVFEVPGISVAGPKESDVPSISIPGDKQQQLPKMKPQIHPQQRRGGLICGGCDGPIVGRIVNAMGARWHPGCFRCTVCDALLEHVSSYEHEGRAYCHLDYHEVGA